MFPYQMFTIVISEIMWLVQSKPIKSNVTRPTTPFSRILCHHKFVMIGYFFHKWCHQQCIMTSSFIRSLSILNIWRCGGLTALWRAQIKDCFTWSLTAINWQLLDCIVIHTTPKPSSLPASSWIISAYSSQHTSLSHTGPGLPIIAHLIQ